MSKTQFSSERWCDSDYANYYFECESPYLDAGLRQSVGPSVLQVGGCLLPSVVDDLDLPYLVRMSESFNPNNEDLVADAAFLPFSPDSFSTVILPHVLEGHSLPHQVLREAHRVLMSEGHIVLTGFNPNSFIGMQRWFQFRAVCSGRYYSVRRVIDWLQLLGFDVVGSSMFHYSPLSRSQGFTKTFQFLESAGDRWLPMVGGGYMISAKKRDVSPTMVGKVRFKTKKRKLVAQTAAKNHIKSLKNSK